ncbi:MULTISPECIES: hypothetical protein [Acetobacter]|uniref:Acyl-CoA synthetase n=2 Tax=Acetobacter TaxID=434 RepID=A0AAN1PJ10_9PROT|nr:MULTISPECIES: hypothetical protein [Acetobacter]ASL39506.1 hypothetical protein CBI36_02930 [Acetobacter oryzifermentans]AXN01066.1 hypothetical protein CJF59_11270 [Acetobacter pomorum]KAA8393071.1 hypothetical protein FKW22_12870 [Acetobacter sp. DmW_125124]KAA8395733.1 hypothetical protein FKW19_09655 [Acetobacter sp. DmW_125128]KAA8398694.1 hypothetical protein FKW20_07005 [Acetobacter sp. DmW_125127]
MPHLFRTLGLFCATITATPALAQDTPPATSAQMYTGSMAGGQGTLKLVQTGDETFAEVSVVGDTCAGSAEGAAARHGTTWVVTTDPEYNGQSCRITFRMGAHGVIGSEEQNCAPYHNGACAFTHAQLARTAQ